MSPADRELLGLCLAEAVNNAIIHAYHEEPGRTVNLEVNLLPETLVFDVIDNGTPGDPKKINSDCRSALELTSPSGAMAQSGRGLAIMQEVMDSVEYTVLADCNRLRMTKRITS